MHSFPHFKSLDLCNALRLQKQTALVGPKPRVLEWAPNSVSRPRVKQRSRNAEWRVATKEEANVVMPHGQERQVFSTSRPHSKHSLSKANIKPYKSL